MDLEVDAYHQDLADEIYKLVCRIHEKLVKKVWLSFIIYTLFQYIAEFSIYFISLDIHCFLPNRRINSIENPESSIYIRSINFNKYQNDFFISSGALKFSAIQRGSQQFRCIRKYPKRERWV